MPSVTQGSAMADPNCVALHNNRVMTDEQLETLRRQISVYSTICRQLMEMQGAAWQQPPSSLPSKLHSYNHFFFNLGNKFEGLHISE